MEAAVQQFNPEVHQRIPGQDAGRHGLAHSGFDGRDELPRDDATDDLAFKFETGSPLQGLQTDDDVDYVIKYAGEDNLTIGTDYGHNDQSTEVDALRKLNDQGVLNERQYRKITYDNPSRLFAL